jgi:hypothetical protein
MDIRLTEFVAFDLFTVPRIGFGVLFGRIILAHERWKALHCAMTEHLTAQWTVPQLIEAASWDTASKSLLRNRDGMYGELSGWRQDARGWELRRSAGG